MTRATTDLTGHWEGIFNYPRSLPPTGFVVTLRDHGGLLSGETTEPGPQGTTLFALIEGHRAGTSVTFVKSYDDHHKSAVHYSGTLNPDATEISGTWRIPGNWSGSFIMVRQAPAEEEEGEMIEEVIID